MYLSILSDINANLTAFNAVLRHFRSEYSGTYIYIHMGDSINYATRPNQILKRLQQFKQEGRLLINLAGNHDPKSCCICLQR